MTSPQTAVQFLRNNPHLFPDIDKDLFIKQAEAIVKLLDVCWVQAAVRQLEITMTAIEDDTIRIPEFDLDMSRKIVEIIGEILAKNKTI
jgi:hypothetical protein